MAVNLPESILNFFQLFSHEELMELKDYQLFINGKALKKRGLDLACNPYNGRVVDDVVLVSESLLKEPLEEEESTVMIKLPPQSRPPQ
ncbi:MAG: hypothetical protein KDK66_05545 [Deltaproteobacteria bacterium]|nr:hypothetical protein [Deltaproteobacteria bacterium]